MFNPFLNHCCSPTPGVHPRLLSEPDPGVEVPQPCPGGEADGPQLPGALPGDVARRRGHRDGRGRRDAQVLERLFQGQVAKSKRGMLLAFERF